MRSAAGRGALAASLACAFVELCVLANRRPALDASALLRLGAFALLGGILVALVPALVARLRRESGVAWGLAAWIGLAVAHAAPLGRSGRLGVTAFALGIAAVVWFVGCALAAAVRRLATLGLSERRVASFALGAACVAAGACGALAFARRAEPPEPPGEGSAARPSVLLVTIDTLRADFVGCYGRREARTPALDALAARGVRFAAATTHSVVTGPSHATILTGLVPRHHGLLENGAPLARSVPGLPELLGGHGYRTGAFVAGYPLQQRVSGMLSRFEHHDDDFRTWRTLPREGAELVLGHWLARVLEWRGERLAPHSRGAHDVVEAANAWLEEADARPFFAWVHCFDPHLPYEPPAELVAPEVRDYSGPDGADWYRLDPRERGRVAADPAARAHMLALYDAEIAAVDRELARLFEVARRAAGPHGVWIVVTADHGESFGEHGIFWERDLYEDSVRVPLIVAPPEPLDVPRVVATSVGLADLAPTLAELAGTTLACDGRSLVPALRGEAVAELEQFAEILPSAGIALRRPAHSVRLDGWKLIVRDMGWDNDEFRWHDAEHTELYELARDPHELDDRHATETARAAALAKPLAEFQTFAIGGPLELPQRELDALRELGYAR
ncbi:MAG: sulfatase [Planctomycetes bacterium]|nr:sulfatase [Planctomycetota bacterium]